MKRATHYVLAALCVFIAALALACSEITALPNGSQHFDPPASYQLWWNLTEACSGRSGNLTDVQWFVVPGATTVPDGRGDVNGYWSEAGNRIVLAGNSQLIGSLVRHEMLHALTQQRGHSRSDFLERCGGTVACIDQCILDAGPPAPPPAGTPQVPPDSLEIGIQVQPVAPNAALFGGYFVLIVTAFNPATHAVSIVLPPSGDAGPGFSFAWSMHGSASSLASNDRVYDSAVTFFAPGETKRDVFDLFIGSATTNDGQVASGDYIAVGAYGDHGSTPFLVSLTP